jgi:ketosteroid isomerase-like protein
MPREHLDALRRGYEAFNRGDITAATELFAEDVDWGTTGNWPGMEAAYRGSEGVDEWTEAVRGEWERFEATLEEVLHDEDDALVVVERLKGRGRESGVETEMRVYATYWFNEQGKLTKRRSFTSADEAIAALRSSDE